VKKNLISKIKSQLLSDRLTILAKQNQDNDIDVGSDDIDLVQARLLANVQNQLSARDKIRMKSIDMALEKIDEGTYGICDECSEEISEKRLLINPMFATCISCAEQIEMEEKRNRRM